MNLMHEIANALPVSVISTARDTLASQVLVPVSPGDRKFGFCAAAAVASAADEVLSSGECGAVLERAMNEGNKLLLVDAFAAAGLPGELALNMLHLNDILEESLRKGTLLKLFDGALELRAHLPR